jgi:hypothetical protein
MARDRNRLCIEDPFEISYNVARTVTKDGLYTVRETVQRYLSSADPSSFVASLCVQRG